MNAQLRPVRPDETEHIRQAGFESRGFSEAPIQLEALHPGRESVQPAEQTPAVEPAPQPVNPEAVEVRNIINELQSIDYQIEADRDGWIHREAA